MTEDNQNLEANNILEPIDIDLDKLFSLSYTFDNLKSFMKNIIKNQQILADKINELEGKSTSQIDENKRFHLFHAKVDKRLKLLENNANNTKKDIENIKKNLKEGGNFVKSNEDKEKDVTESEDKEILENKAQIKRLSRKSLNNENDYSFNEYSEKDDDYYSNMVSNKEIQEIKEKINNLEQQISEIKAQNEVKPPINTLKPTDFILDDKNSDIDLIKLEIQNLKEKTEIYKIESDSIKKKMEDISVKVMDFDVFDVFKESGMEGGSVDAAKVLIKNLEQKFTHKNEIIDEKMKKNEEDIYKLKNDFQNLKNESDVISYNLNNFKSKIKELVEQVGITSDNNSNLVNEINGKLTETYKKLLEKIEEEKNELKKNIEKIKKQIKALSNKGNNNDDKDKIKGYGLSEEDLKLLSDLTKRINTAEKHVKGLITISSEIPKIKEKFIQFENTMTLKTNITEFEEYTEKLNSQINMNNSIRDMVEKVQDMATKNMKDLGFFLNKIESLSATVLAVKEALETLSGMKQENIIDVTQFVDQLSFKDFISRNNKDKDKLEKNIDELRRLFKDILEGFNKKADEKDLRDFELLLNNKLEELKLMSGKKFADKIDTGKTIKYLDTQIKYLSENILKRTDRNDSWLIAKKPMGGHACASCESYLGDLKGNDEFIAWNKYPQRERDTNYRLGNGFSRMLNMLNIDIKNTFDIKKENNDSDNDNNNINNFDKKRLMTSPVNFNNSSTSNNNFSKNKNNHNLSTMNNFGQSNALPKINMTLSKDDLNNDSQKNFNMSSLQMNSKSLNKKNKNKENNQLNIVKIFKKNNK
jgi:chromosome segregation ATPase